MSRDPIRLGIVGIGKIARDQHLPVIAADDDFHLAAAASRHGVVEGAAMYDTLDAMLEAEPGLQAVSLCTPPQGRYALARAILAAGKSVLLEKPPGATLSEVESLRTLAAERGRTLFATWHSRFAPAVAPARTWLASRTLRSVRIDWREDVRHWHPNQAWIWEAGGLGVFDPGVNALSIATAILPRAFFLTDGELRFPQNRDAPISADLTFHDEADVPITAAFDWLQVGPQTWDIRVDTDAGALVMSNGGADLRIDGEAVQVGNRADLHVEYAGLYRRFAELLRSGASDVDVAPLRHVADAFLRARRRSTAPFED